MVVVSSDSEAEDVDEATPSVPTQAETKISCVYIKHNRAERIPTWRRVSKAEVTPKPKLSLSQSLLWPSTKSPARKSQTALSDDEDLEVRSIQKPKPRMMLRDSLQGLLGSSNATFSSSTSSLSPSLTTPTTSPTFSPSLTPPSVSVATPVAAPLVRSPSPLPSPSSSSELSIDLSPPTSYFTSSKKAKLEPSLVDASPSLSVKSTQRKKPKTEDLKYDLFAFMGGSDTPKCSSGGGSSDSTKSTGGTGSVSVGVSRGGIRSISNSISSSKNCSSSSSSGSSSCSGSSGGDGGKSKDTGELWVDKYTPTTEADLCVHAKKIKDLKTWIVDNYCALHSHARNGQVLLLLDGPPGSAKSSTIRVIAESLGLRIVSWDDRPDGISYEQSRALYGTEYALPYEGRIKSFKQFFARSKRYPALNMKLEQLALSDAKEGDGSTEDVARINRSAPAAARKLILIHDFPFVPGHKHNKGKDRDKDELNLQEQFREVIRDVLQSSQYLVVFVVSSHHEKNNDLLQIFGEDLMANPKVAHISCNPIAPTGIAKALERVIQGEQLAVSDSIVDQLVQNSNGDVRNAIHSLQFEALGVPIGKPPSKPRKRKTKKASPLEEGRKALGLRDVNYSIFHSLGKILHAKAGVDPEQLVDNSEMNDMSFTEYLHQNYMDYLPMDDLPRIEEMLEIFGDADILAQAANQRFGNSLSSVPESYSSALAVRGYLTLKTGALQDTSAHWNKKGFLAQRGPLSGKVRRTAENYRAAARTLFVPSYYLNGEAMGPAFGCPSTDMFVDTLPFLACVLNSSPSSTPPCSSSFSSASSSGSSCSSFPSSSSTSALRPFARPAPPPVAALHQGHWTFLKLLCWDYGTKYQARDLTGIATAATNFCNNRSLLSPPSLASEAPPRIEEIDEDIEEC